MYALIDKNTNAILKVGAEYFALSDAKPFHWVECPDDVTTAWTYDGSFHAPVTPAPTKDQLNAPVLAQLEEIDRRSIRALREGNTQRISDLEAQAVSLRAQLVR